MSLRFKSTLEGARYMVETHGLRVTPLRGKAPFERDWKKRARATLSEVAADFPEANNVGVVCEGITVVDIDPRNMGINTSDEMLVEDVIRQVRTLYGLGPTLEVVSGRGDGGVHLYYRGVTRTGRLTDGVDLKSDGVDHQVVGPGSIHPDTGERYWVLVDTEIAPLPSSLVQRSTEEVEWDGETAEITHEGVAEGGRNDTMYRNLCRMRSKGMGDAEIEAYAEAINRLQFQPPLPKDELEVIVAQALKHDPGQEVIDSWMLDGPRVQSLPEGITPIQDLDIQEPEYLIEGVLPRYGVAQLVGHSGTGKSFFAIDLALTLSHPDQSEWFGYEVGDAPVVYVAMEGAFDLQMRLDAWHKNRGLGDTRTTTAKAYFLVESHFNMVNGEYLRDEFITPLVDIGPGLVIIDTQSLAAPGVDENDATAMTRLMKSAKFLSERLGCLVLLVQHTGNAKGAQGRARGSSAQYSNLDLQLLLNTAGTGRNTSRTVRVTKLKSGMAPEAGFPFRLEGVPITRGEKVFPSAAVERLDVQTVIYAEMDAHQEEVLQVKLKPSAAVALAVMRKGGTAEEFGWRELAEGWPEEPPSKKTLLRALNELAEVGAVKVLSSGTPEEPKKVILRETAQVPAE